METFLILIFGIILSIIAEISKKTKISQTNILIGSVFVIATIYVLLNELSPELVQKGIQIGLSILGVASGLYMSIQKYLK